MRCLVVAGSGRWERRRRHNRRGAAYRRKGSGRGQWVRSRRNGGRRFRKPPGTSRRGRAPRRFGAGSPWLAHAAACLPPDRATGWTGAYCFPVAIAATSLSKRAARSVLISGSATGALPGGPKGASSAARRGCEVR